MNRRTLLAGLAGGIALTAARCGSDPAFAGTTTLRLPRSPRVLIMGDSYTEGVGGDPKTNGWAYLVGPALGWRVTIDGVGGTGYINPGPVTTKVRGRYADRLWRRKGQVYDLVVLAGGSNDSGSTRAEIAGAVNMTVRTVQRLFPTAQLLIFGPSSPYGPKPDRVRVDEILASWTARHGVAYVSPVGEAWFRAGDGGAYANSVNGHPNNAGYRLIADRFVADVKAATR